MICWNAKQRQYLSWRPWCIECLTKGIEADAAQTTKDIVQLGTGNKTITAIYQRGQRLKIPVFVFSILEHYTGHPSASAPGLTRTEDHLRLYAIFSTILLMKRSLISCTSTSIKTWSGTTLPRMVMDNSRHVFNRYRVLFTALRRPPRYPCCFKTKRKKLKTKKYTTWVENRWHQGMSHMWTEDQKRWRWKSIETIREYRESCIFQRWWNVLEEHGSETTRIVGEKEPDTID